MNKNEENVVRVWANVPGVKEGRCSYWSETWNKLENDVLILDWREGSEWRGWGGERTEWAMKGASGGREEGGRDERHEEGCERQRGSKRWMRREVRARICTSVTGVCVCVCAAPGWCVQAPEWRSRTLWRWPEGWRARRSSPTSRLSPQNTHPYASWSPGGTQYTWNTPRQTRTHVCVRQRYAAQAPWGSGSDGCRSIMNRF